MRICFIGDSFVNGTGDDACLGWAGRLCRDARAAGREVTYYNLGVRRDTSADIARRWRAEAAPRLPVEHPGALVFSFGVNDCVTDGGLRRVALVDTLGHARSILSEASVLRSTLMVGPPPVIDAAANARIVELSAALAKPCHDSGVPYLPVFEKLARSPVWRDSLAGGDGAHPRANGYELWAGLVSAWEPWRELVR